MEVLSISPFRAGSVLWRPRPDRWTLTVVCKATYALAPGESPLSDEQEGINEHDGYWDDDPRRSVHAPSDLAPFKPRADVVLVGHAFAPRSELVRSLVARLLVGEMSKAIEVFCPRVLGREGDLREGQRWSKMPLRYEYAAGGLDTWNPVGIPPNAPADAYGQRPLPHLQPPGLRVTQWLDVFVPVGFGPISPSWRLRRDKLDRRAEGWSDEGWTRIALDDDFDGEFFQTAPPDQQIDALHDDERLLLEYLHPDHPSLTTKLPGVHPHAFVELPGSGARDLVMTADTLWIDTDRSLCTLTWRGQVAVDGPDQQGRVIIAMEEAGQALNWAAISGQRSGGTLAPSPDGPRPGMNTLPFVSPTHPPESEASEPPVVHPRRRTLPMVPEVPPPDPTSPTAGARQTLQMLADGPALAPTWVAPGTSPAESVALPPPPTSPGIGRASDGIGRTSEPTQVSMQLGGLDGEPGRGSPNPSEEVSKPPLTMGEAPTPPKAREKVRERAIELVWFAPSLVPRLRDLAAIELPSEPQGAADVAAVLAGGAPSTVPLEQALFEAAGDGGVLAPPLLLLHGEIAFPFDEVEELRALITAAKPTGRADPALSALLELAEGMSRTELQASPEVAEGLCSSLRVAWTQANQVLPPGHLAQQVERALLFRRAYQRRWLLGKKCVRALVSFPTENHPVPAYLPAAAAARLPLFRRFPARMVAEVLPPQDQSEASPVALRIGALAREVVRGG